MGTYLSANGRFYTSNAEIRDTMCEAMEKIGCETDPSTGEFWFNDACRYSFYNEVVETFEALGAKYEVPGICNLKVEEDEALNTTFAGNKFQIKMLRHDHCYKQLQDTKNIFDAANQNVSEEDHARWTMEGGIKNVYS